MLCIEDCLALSGLGSDEADVVAAHEHIPFIVAVAKAHHMLDQAWGDAAVRQMVWDALCEAQRRRQVMRVLALRDVYRRTCHQHPGAVDRRRFDRHGAAPIWSH